MFDARKSLGLAVTEQGLTAVLLGGAGGPKARRTVIGTAQLPFSAEVGLSDPDKLGRELRKVLRQAGLLTRTTRSLRCVIGLAAAWIATREKSLPATDDESLRAALAIVAEREFASGPADLVFDYAAGAGGRGRGDAETRGRGENSEDSATAPKISAILAAAPRRIIEPLLAMAKAAGLTIAGVTSSSLALAMATAAPQGAARGTARLTLCLLPAGRGVELTVQGPPIATKSDWGPPSASAVTLIRHLPISLNASNGDLKYSTAQLSAELRRILAATAHAESGLASSTSASRAAELLIWNWAARLTIGNR